MCQNDSTLARPSNIRIAFNGSLIYPGALVGIDVPMQEVLLVKQWKDGGAAFITKQRYLTANLGYYHHPGFHDNLYVLPEWVMKRTKGTKWFTEFSAGLGYSRTFLGGTTYRVDEAGNVSIVPLAGYSYAVLATGFELGFNTKAMGVPFSVYSKFSMLVFFPYNSTIYPRPTIEIGVQYSPGRFLVRTFKLVHKEKGVK